MKSYPLQLLDDLQQTLQLSGLTISLTARVLGFDGRTMASWRTYGVPENYIGHVQDVIETLTGLIEAGELPKTMQELAWIGLNQLVVDYGSKRQCKFPPADTA